MTTQRISALARVVDTAEAFRDADKNRNTALRDAYAAGVKVVDLVDLLEEAGAPLGRQQVHRIVAGVHHRPVLDVDQVVASYADGVSARALAQQYRVSTATIKEALTGAGVELRGREAAKQAARSKVQA